MDGRIVLDECSGPHKDDGHELSHSDEPEDQLLQSHLDVGLVEPFVDPDDHRVVDQVEEEEVQQQGLAYLRSRLLNRRVGRCVPNYCVGSDPREQLVNIVEAFASNRIASPEDHDDDSRSSHDSSVDVERGDDRDHHKTENNFEQIEHLQPHG
jgi:hypothetical protein